LAKFEEFFKVRQNIIFERAKFNKRAQLEGESAEQYITTLYHLAETCNYRDMKAEMIHDRLVVYIRDQWLSQQLQMDPNLTLEQVKTRVRQKEAISQQQEILKDKPEVLPTSDLEDIKYKRKIPTKRSDNMSSHSESSAKSCTRCGQLLAER